MHKTDRAELFRTRLAARLALTGMSRSALARAADVDRSTIAQLLSGDEVRLPNAHLAAECASALGVSADWLLGLSDRPESAAEVLSANFRMEAAQRTPADEQIIAWHQEAAGHKIRHVRWRGARVTGRGSTAMSAPRRSTSWPSAAPGCIRR